MEIIFFIVALCAVCFGVKLFVVDPFVNGTRQIDKHKYPTLERTQRILRARNTQKRDRELEQSVKSCQDESSHRLKRLETLANSARTKDQIKHATLMDQWTSDFRAIDKSQADKHLFELVSKKFAPIGTYDITEKYSIENLRIREKEYEQCAKAWATGGATGESYGSRQVKYGISLHVRQDPSPSGLPFSTLAGGTAVHVDGWLYGDPILNPDTGDYTNIWFRLANSTPDLYVWSGALNNGSTHGLARLDTDATETAEYLKAVERFDYLSTRQTYTPYVVNQMQDLADIIHREQKYLSSVTRGPLFM